MLLGQCVSENELDISRAISTTGDAHNIYAWANRRTTSNARNIRFWSDHRTTGYIRRCRLRG